jgi:hypothetical protein
MHDDPFNTPTYTGLGEPPRRPRKRWVAVLAALVATFATAVWEVLPIPQMLGDIVAEAVD